MMLPTSHNNRAFPPTKGELRLSNHMDPLQGVMPLGQRVRIEMQLARIPKQLIHEMTYPSP
jgi:hypothetical protein